MSDALDTLRKVIGPHLTMDCDRGETQDIWDAMQNLEAENKRLRDALERCRSIAVSSRLHGDGKLRAYIGKIHTVAFKSLHQEPTERVTK